LFPGASIAERRWGAERFRSVAQWCLGEGLQVALVGGGGDAAETGQIAAGLDVLDLAGRTNLAETAAVLERAAVVVSGDSGILHIAVGLGRPTVALFGPGIVVKWAPRGPAHVVLNKQLSCSPCTRFGYTPACPHASRCLAEISIDEVTAGIAQLMPQSLLQG
jgi:ADP-heptose:LPS heptosyltransferase